MTTQRQEELQSQSAPDDGDFQIVDETSEEQLEEERRLLGASSEEGEQPGDSGEQEGDGEPGAEAETEPEGEPPQRSAQAQQQQPEPETQQPEQPRTFSEEEFRKAQSAWDRRNAELERQNREYQQRIQQFNLQTEVETELRRQERELEPQLGREDARASVRTQQNQDSVAQRIQERNALRALTQYAQQQDQQQEQQARQILARDFARENDLPADTLPDLLEAQTPEGMERIAKRLGTFYKNQKESQQAAQQRVPAESQATSLESGTSSAPAQTEDARADRIRQKPAWEWTQEEYDLMRMRAGGLRR